MKPTNPTIIPELTLDSVYVSQINYSQQAPNAKANVLVTLQPYDSNNSGSIYKTLSKQARISDINIYPELGLALNALDVALQLYINSSSVV